MSASAESVKSKNADLDEENVIFIGPDDAIPMPKTFNSDGERCLKETEDRFSEDSAYALDVSLEDTALYVLCDLMILIENFAENSAQINYQIQIHEPKRNTSN